MEKRRGREWVGAPDVDEVELEDPRANASVTLCSTRAAERKK